MAQTATLHIKVEPQVAKSLKRVAGRRKVTVGELIRQAVQACYQPDLMGLGTEQRRAVAAYQGGYIGLGKLAEEFGLSPLQARQWLQEHDIPQSTAFDEDDLIHA